MKVLLQLILGSASLLFFMSCASTQSSRIKEREKDFLAYPPEVQQQIQSGNVDKGFTEDMVYISKGTPSEKSSQVKSGKTITIWKYPKSETQMVEPPRGSAPTGFSGAYEYPTPGAVPRQAPIFYGKPMEIIEFENGKVSGWR